MSEEASSDLVKDTGKALKKPYSLKKKLLIGGAILLVLSMIGFNIYRVKNKDVVQVSASKVVEKHLVEKVPASGNVVAVDREIIFSEVSGTVKAIHVQMGDKVTTGQVLMDLYIPNADQKLAEARATLASAESSLYQARSGGKTADLVSAQSSFTQAESTYKQDKDALERNQILFQQGAVAQADLDKVQADFDTSQAAYNKAQADLQRAQDAAPVYLQSLEAAVESARLQLELVEKQTARQGLLCTHDGQILSITVKPGDQINESSPLLTIGNLQQMSIQADVPESEAGKIRVGEVVAITGNAFQGETYQGKVAQVGLEVLNKTKKNENEDTFLPVTVGVEQQATHLLPGYNVDLEITTADSQALVVPIEALVEKDEGDSVWVIKDGLAHLIPVKTGISDGITMEIKEGAAKDDQVVLNPPAQLKEGSKVRVQ
ncbi:MAG TPA: efflux RND transporter periplasmic adaptor subunit [Syntrophomonadaceae bacterium]|nr:efflux RND transporter periplasmic adaptor subunit [Syntrophomonadaceae bacterium]